jgi:hypothetical protein
LGRLRATPKAHERLSATEGNNIMTTSQTAIVALVFTLVGVSYSFADCPTGSYSSVDNFGNQICRAFGSGATMTIQGDVNNCPSGTYSSVDNWGNQICKGFSGNSQYYDTSRGCPNGTYSSVDNWGNQICKGF